MEGGERGQGMELETEKENLLGQRSFPSLRTAFPVQAQESGELQPIAAEGFRGIFTASLIQNFVSYTNSSKHRQPLFVRFLFPSLYYYPLLLFHNTAAGNPKEEGGGGEEGKHLQCACPSFILGSL